MPSDLEDLDGVGPVEVGLLPWFAIRQAFREHVQIEDGVVFWVLDLALEQLHDVQERVQGTADVNNCKQKRRRTRALSPSEQSRLTPGSGSKTALMMLLAFSFGHLNSVMLTVCFKTQ